MKKTVLGIFYNEEWLLPFWLKHHREIFDHGIMIDYRSTDRSVEIIRELCPTWEIHTSRNDTFDANGVDNELKDYERPLEGWRVSLNIPEFVFGNYDRLDDDPTHRNIYIQQYSFTDMERRDEPYYLNSDLPLYKQRWWGYGGGRAEWDFTKAQSHGSSPRSLRSIHNFAWDYDGPGVSTGRHVWENEQSFVDLCIFYYGFASLEEASIKRRMQIQTQIPGGGTSHNFSLGQLMDKFRLEQQPLSRDMRPIIKPIVDVHEAYLANKKAAQAKLHVETHQHIQSAIDALQNALNLSKPQ